MMLEQEKVTLGLECCNNLNCGACPYAGIRRCLHELHADAAAWLKKAPEPPEINAKELKVIYKAILDKMGPCIDEMITALRNDDIERYLFLVDQYKRLRDIRTHYLQKIDIIKENLMEVLDIAEEVHKIQPR